MSLCARDVSSTGRAHSWTRYHCAGDRSPAILKAAYAACRAELFQEAGCATPERVAAVNTRRGDGATSVV